MDLPLLFALVAAGAVALYVIADGFDLGIGILFLIAPRDRDRDLMMQSVAPFWDGNETWLVLGGAMLWAAFPMAYYVLLPAFYLPIMAMLFALILRGISFEFRFQATRLRRVWDFAFAGGSLVAAICQGLILGGFIQGVVVENGRFAGGPFSFLSVLGLLCAAGIVGGYALLGAGWLIWRTEGKTQLFAREVAHSALLLAIGMMAVVSAWTALTEPRVAARWFAWPANLWLDLFPLAAMGVAILLWRSLWDHHDRRPFLLAVVLFLLGYAGLIISIWPDVVPYHASIWQAAADVETLKFALLGIVVVLPLVLAYTAHAYRVFRGKTVLDAHGADAEAYGHAGRRTAALSTDLHLS
ncbi:cytochrome d ubiquinol oxidase subunit II [Methylobacterium nonmethylotrophicum]|uniref:Cytochrome d ubiquinol oxidase subunit II n=1 Tax=Methylobacterium nonmethylotrophicum TaxID=1141884 RepID=A0A4Z0NSE2_9HYPH|nr:cytochrome d ubiquinol oxidase subunit II [Methylobacterium nonmethylotrophicum]TGD99654.1 cytochrome d ubiquinol oxidase subunit II [Methylobacterium nonmethylotrophicum]